MSYNISNSLINAYTDYKNEKLCGKLFEAVYLKKTHQIETTEAMQYGKWFEFLCTGTLNRDGSEPEPVLLKTGKLNTESKRVKSQVDNFLKLYKDKNYNSNLIFEHKINGKNFKGIFDIAEVDKNFGLITIRDIKMTAVIDDKWSDYGWVDIENKKHINQAKFYIWLYWKKTNKIVPFYFDVFSRKNEYDFKIIKVEMSKTALIDFETYLMQAVEMLEFDIATGLIAYPTLKGCRECPLKKECDFFTDIPEVEIIKL